MKRRTALVLLSEAGLSSLVLTGCGFTLRSSLDFGFQTLAVLPNPGGAVAIELRRSFGNSVRVLAPGVPVTAAQVVFELLEEQREKIVVGVNSSGQVREFQLRIRVKFRVSSGDGKELLAATELVQQRGISFTESAALAKEAEEVLLYRAMQTDIVQQLVRRLAALSHADRP